MPEKAITAKIDFNKSEQYILSIRLSTDGFSFSVYNPIRDCYVLNQQWSTETNLSFTANLKQAFKELEFLSYTYKQVNIVWVGIRFTLIPLDLFEQEQIAPLFHYNYRPRENEIILYNTLDKNGVAVLFGIDKSAYDFLSDRHAEIQFYASVTSLAEYFAVKSRTGSDKKVYVCLQPGFIEVYAYERGHLLLLNSYECRDTADCIYYILYSWKQFDMDQFKDEIYITGGNTDSETKKCVEELQRFVQHVSVIQMNEPNKV